MSRTNMLRLQTISLSAKSDLTEVNLFFDWALVSAVGLTWTNSGVTRMRTLRLSGWPSARTCGARMSTDLTDRIEAFLDAHHVVSLATLGPDGPHAANLFYVRDGLALIWVSDPASRHSEHIAAHPAVAATIAPDYSDFPEIRGLQLHGRAQLIASGEPQARAHALMQARFAFLRTTSAPDSPLRAAWERARFYRLEPGRIVLIDNTRSFGSKEILELGGRP